MAGFQSVINIYQARGVEGDFASANPTASYFGGEGHLIVGQEPVIVGRFAWAVDGVVSNTGKGKPQGFVHRVGQASIVNYLDSASMAVQAGRCITLLTRGDFYVKSSTPATVGQKVFASLADGSIATADAGATVDGHVETDFGVVGADEGDGLVTISAYI